MKPYLKTVSPAIAAIMVFTVFFFSTSVLHAQSGQLNLKKKPPLSPTVRQPAVSPVTQPVTVSPTPIRQPAVIPVTKPVKALPDLIVNSTDWSHKIKPGDTVGTSSILTVTVRNQGTAGAGSGMLKISCQSVSGAACPAGITSTINVQPLGAGQSMSYAWPSANPSAKWGIGKYRITFQADAAAQVPEANESNNTGQLTFSVRPEMTIPKTVQNVTQAQPGGTAATAVSVTIPVTSPQAGSKHAAAKPLPVSWNKGTTNYYSLVNIMLIDGQTGSFLETIKNNAPNTGGYSAWMVPEKYAWPGTAYRIKITTPDKKISGQSGVFTIYSKPKKKVPFMIDAVITNGWAYKRGGDLSDNDCMFAPQIPAGRQPGSHEVKIGHFNKEGRHGSCGYYDIYHFRSKVFFDMNFFQGKEIVEAALLIRKGETIQLVPNGTLGSNAGISEQCDIYLLNSPWPGSPQPLNNFYPGTFLKSFSLFSQGETGKIDLLEVVRDWTSGKPNHGLMLRDPLNVSHYVNLACVKYYNSVKLVGWYME